MVKIYDQTLDVHAMITHRLHYGFFPLINLNMFLSLLPTKSKTILSHPCCILVMFLMAHVVRLEPNGCHALLSHDDVIKYFKSQGWDAFLKIFEGYNL
jgi:hypothetical protein